MADVFFPDGEAIVTKDITLALGIPHTPWVEERKASLARLVDALTPTPREVVDHRVFGERAKNHEWSEAMWKWAAETSATHFVTLQDDVLVAPNFWPALRAMLEAMPDQVVGLEVVHPATRALAEDGHRWFTTSEGLVGVGYVLPRSLLREFLEWRAHALKKGAVEAISEDTLLGLWCMVTGLRVHHPIPTLIDHDTSLASTYANDAHANRRPPVKWSDDVWQEDDEEDALEDEQSRLESPDFWRESPDYPELPIRHLGRFYEATPGLAMRWVEHYGAWDYTQAVRDDGRAALRSLGRARLARLPEPKARILVCTPTRGAVHPAYASTIAKLASAPDLDVEPCRFTTERYMHATSDIVRARSRFVRLFLESDATHLLFVDDDVSFETALVRGMLAASKDFVAAPYPSRRGIDFPRAGRAGPELAEASAYRYSVHLLGDTLEISPVDSTGEVRRIGLGCALLSRRCLESMVAEYQKPEHRLVFADRLTGTPVPTVALFTLVLEDGELYSEDFSFCDRWRAVGGKVWLYLGAGAPATHHGDHTFRGHLEAFGLRPVST